MTLKRTALLCGAALSALLGVAALAVALAVYRPQILRPWVERALSPRGGTASLSVIEASLSPPALSLSGLAITPPPSAGGGSLRVDHLRIELNPGRFFLGGPWVRNLEARGVIFERPRPQEAEGPPDLTPLTRLFDIEKLSLADARLRLAMSQGVLAVDGLRMTLAPGKGGTRAFNGSADLSFHGKGSSSFAGRLSASGIVTPEPAFTVDFVSDKGRLALPRISGDVSCRARLRVTRKSLQVPEWSLSAKPGEVLYEGRPLPLGSVSIRGSARPEADSWRVDAAEIRTGSVGRWTGRVEFRGGTANGTVDGKGLPADNLVALAAVLGGYEWENWSPTGTVDIAARSDPREGGQRVAATATLGQVGFRSPGGDAMGQLLGGTVDVAADLVPRPRGTVSLALRRGEALWGTVYLDLAKGPLDLRVGGTRTGTGVYEDLVLDGRLEGFGRLRIEGKARREGGGWSHRGRLALRDSRLGPIFRTFLRDPLASSHPDLGGLEMEGNAAGDLSFSGTGSAADVDGRLRLRLADVHRAAEPPLLSGLDLDLPISYSLGAANPARPDPSDAIPWGRLRLEKVRIGGQEVGPLEVPAALVPNRLHLGGEIRASLYGANLTLRSIRADEPLSREFRVRMAAVLGELDLSRIAGTGSIQGRIGGVLDPVVIGPDRVTAEGELRGDLFGGRLGVRRVTVERPFSAGREIGADVTVDRIDLERFSAVLGIGRITGRLSGSMAGLRVAYGQPVAFHLKMESVPVKGVEQTVSLKAVNSISLMSTGSSLSGLGISMMTTFFREFPYEKIGFECGLKNDVFTVRGLIHEGGVEYLVKRRFFAGINVINGNPDNRIGFSDMLERAKRVTGERTN